MGRKPITNHLIFQKLLFFGRALAASSSRKKAIKKPGIDPASVTVLELFGRFDKILAHGEPVIGH